LKKNLTLIFSFAFLAVIAWSIYWVVSQIGGQFKLLDPKVSVAILTTSSTIIVATLTVVLGKYIERKKDIEAHYREKKTEIYDEFLSAFFKTFYSNNEDENEGNPELVDFLREWQRKMILWGGQDVLSKYILWMAHLKKGELNAKTMFMMEELFFEIRKTIANFVISQNLK